MWLLSEESLCGNGNEGNSCCYWNEEACLATEMKGVFVDSEMKEACVATDIKV